MQSILVRRCYATTISNIAALARTKSTPLAVRLRRAKRAKRTLRPDRHDAAPSGATPTEHARYKRLVALGNLTDKQGRAISEKEWLESLNARRSRIRGIKRVTTATGQKENRVVGQKIYLPNIIFKMVRNYTPRGQPYNPYEATFRVPPSVTKTDIRSYLYSVYGVKTTYIRTDNYVSPLFRKWGRRSMTYVTRSYRTYKRAVVGLVEPFYYPMAMEDMSEADRAERLKQIESNYGIARNERERKLLQLEQTRASGKKDQSGFMIAGTWKWRGEPTSNRGKILQLVAMRRAARESELENAKRDMLSARAQGTSVVA